MTLAEDKVRPADPADLEELVLLLGQLFALETDFDYNPAKQRRGLQLLMANPGALVLVAERQGRVVGMCTGQLLVSTAEGGCSVLVEDVVVLPAWQGQGIGSALLAALGDWAQDQGATRLQLLADRANTPAFAFYRHLGRQTTELVCLRQVRR